MDDFKIFITDSLANYDKNMDRQNKLLKDAISFTIVTSPNEMKKDKIIFFDEKKKILEASYEIISIYTLSNNVWTWGWGQPSIPKKNSAIVRKILDYGFSLDSNKNYFLKAELVNSRFVISDPIQIDIHLAICSELSKINNIYPLAIYTKKEKEQYYEINSDEFSQDQLGVHIIKNIDTSDIRITYIFMFDIKEF